MMISPRKISRFLHHLGGRTPEKYIHAQLYGCRNTVHNPKYIANHLYAREVASTRSNQLTTEQAPMHTGKDIKNTAKHHVIATPDESFPKT